jgi:hypothetical protein
MAAVAVVRDTLVPSSAAPPQHSITLLLYVLRERCSGDCGEPLGGYGRILTRSAAPMPSLAARTIPARGRDGAVNDVVVTGQEPPEDLADPAFGFRG